MADVVDPPEDLPTWEERRQYREHVARDLRAAVELVNSGLREAVAADLAVYLRIESPLPGEAPEIKLNMSMDL